MNEVDEQVLQGAREALAFACGELKGARVHMFPDLVAIRKRMKLSQAGFAKRFGIPVATIRDWEQGRRMPDATARNYLKVIAYAPETAERAISS